jgi:S-adenosylmethionine-diacylglycerol 3-amino-3-carboxypropyl transferase
LLIPKGTILSRSAIEAGSIQLKQAVHRASPISRQGILERMFTFAFRHLVYPQIWEDPEVDLRALDLRPDSRVVAIASGGCNVLSYLTANPREIVAVDLNRAHVALTRLKLVGARHLPTHDVFLRFFGRADEGANVAAYERFLRANADDETRTYWEGRDHFGRRRISLFARGIYRHGLLGHFVGMGHFVARLYGIDPRKMTSMQSIEEQRDYFERVMAPLFDKRLVRWATSQKVSLYGLGIPPAQYDALATAGGDMASVLRERLGKLACGFPMSENYFAWQAFSRSYSRSDDGPLPPYLKRENFEAVRERSERVKVVHGSLTDHLDSEPVESLDAFVLLDAQDWMTDAQLNALWSSIARTARPGARIIFRTAAAESVLPGRVDESILSRLTYEAARSRELGAADRSSIYGGFHIYVFNG